MGGNQEKKLTLVVDLINKTEAGFRKLSQDMNDAQRKVEATSKALITTGRAMTMGITLPLVAAGTASVLAAANFEKSLGDLSTLVNGNAESMAVYEQGIKDVLAVVPKSADELGAAAYQIVSAGISDASQAMDVLEQSGKLATAGLGDTEQAVDLMTSAINAFGLDADDSGQIADVLFKTVKAGKTTVGQLATAFGQVAPIAAEMGVSFEELQAATAALTTSGLKTSVAQSQLKAAMSSLMKPTAEAQQLLDKLGAKTFKELIETSGGLVGAFVALTEASAGNETQLAKAAGSVEGLGAILSLTGNQAEAFESTLDSMRNGSDELTAAFESQRQTFLASWQLIKNKLNVAMIKFGTVIMPLVKSVLEGVATAVEKVANGFDKLSPGIQKAVIVLIALLAITGPLLWMTGLLMKATTALALVYSTRLRSAIVFATKVMKAAVVVLKYEVTWTKIAAASKLTYAKATKIASTALAFMSGTIKKVVAALKVFRIAMISTGIGALIVLLGFIIASFLSLTDTVGGVGNAIKLFWAEFQVLTLKAIEAFIKGIANVLNMMPGVDNALGDTIETMGWLREAAENDSTAIAEEIAKQGAAAKVAADDVELSAEEIEQSMVDILGATEDTAIGSEDYAERLSEAIKEIRDEIRATYNDIASATADFQKSIGQEQISYEEDVVNATAKAYEKKKELERELKKLRREDDPSSDQISRLEDQISEQSNIISSYKDLQLELDEEVAERREYLRADEIEKLTIDHNRRLQMLKKEYLEDQVKYLTKLLQLKQEEVFILASLDTQTRAALEADLAKDVSHRKLLSSQKEGLTSWMSETKTMYDNYVQDINRAFDSIEGSGRVRVTFTAKGSGARAAGGPVQPGRTFVVGEKGPELFTPGQHGLVHSAGRGGSSSVNVYFTGNHFTDERYAEMIQKKIVTDLQKTMKLSVQ